MLERGLLGPDDLEPDVTHFKFYIAAFQELGTCRSGGMGVGPIPFHAVKAYYDVMGVEEDFEEFLYLIRAMDEALLEEINRQQKEKEGKAKNATGKTD